MAHELHGRRIAFMIANEGAEQVELTEPWQAVRDASGTPELLAPSPGNAQAFNHLDKADTFGVDRAIGDADPADHGALVLPGGVANPDRLRTLPAAVDFARSMFEAGAAVFGYSGGGPSAIQFAFRHTRRTTALILMASALPGKAGAPLKALARALFGSDRLFWLLKSYAPSLFARILGMPKGFRPTPGERGRIEQTMDILFPIPPRKRGVLFDLYVSNPDVQTYPLEQISCPTLIINAKDDGLSAFDNAAQASRRIQRSKLVAIDRGGHLLLGSATRIKEEIVAFEKSAT